VLDLEVARNRIALTLRLDDEVAKAGSKTQGAPRGSSRSAGASQATRKPAPASGGGVLAEALRRAGEKKGRGKVGE
jgi:protein Tex